MPREIEGSGSQVR